MTEDKDKEIEKLQAYRDAVMEMASYRYKRVDDYIMIAKQAVQDYETGRKHSYARRKRSEQEKQLKSLSMHNADQKAIRYYQNSFESGVACDCCGSEMRYSDLNVMLLSNPAQMTVTCTNEDCKDYNKIKYKVV